jgi:thioredoxin reductase (NADPH)
VPVAVVGGGNSAGQATLFLCDHASRVWLLVRGDDLGKSMSRYLIDRIERDPRIEVRLRTEVRELLGDDRLEGIVVESSADGGRERLDTGALFVFIGADPCTPWLAGHVALDRRGFVLTGADVERSEDAGWPDAQRPPYLLETSRPGIFAVGDVRSGSVKRVASAVGEGAMAVQFVHRRLA